MVVVVEVVAISFAFVRVVVNVALRFSCCI